MQNIKDIKNIKMSFSITYLELTNFNEGMCVCVCGGGGFTKAT